MATVLATPLLVATASGAEALSKEDTCSLAYVLQAGDLAARRALVVSQLADSKRDVLILDRNYSGNDKPWSVAEVQTIRQAQPARRVIAYLSIGEAEDYREYWQKNWSVSDDGKRSKATPSFVVAPNPNWPGNYKVRYWDKRWQALVFKQLQEIVAAEFDGIYLDIIDAFELFEYDAATDQWLSHRKNPATGRTFRQDMVRWVQKLARRARSIRPGFVVVPQNGSALLENPDYVQIVDGIGIEDLYTVDNTPQDPLHTQEVLGHLQHLKNARKPVFLVEYTQIPRQRDGIRRAAIQEGFVVLFTNRALNQIGTSPACGASS